MLHRRPSVVTPMRCDPTDVRRRRSASQWREPSTTCPLLQAGPPSLPLRLTPSSPLHLLRWWAGRSVRLTARLAVVAHTRAHTTAPKTSFKTRRHTANKPKQIRTASWCRRTSSSSTAVGGRHGDDHTSPPTTAASVVHVERLMLPQRPQIDRQRKALTRGRCAHTQGRGRAIQRALTTAAHTPH